ncbi:glucan endo-1,3-beta-glucosidase 5-like [Impatiens glandulifera]|uniref:glucan endo-1,3-beta-glucosidase 5-like n=1 Tax=Impatiens glandulifera TaxID=253017 RepID=UPI001FB0BF8E|nr:glucan endo-1,3-beta-glucosidase 5-like [Impatiens glandulifera]
MAIFPRLLFCLIVFCKILAEGGFFSYGLACNWGLQSTHPLPPKIVVKLLKENGFDKVKLFEPEPGPLKALGNSGIQVMVGIPNDFLAPLASSVNFAIEWVTQNISSYVSKYGVDIRYVGVGNEPFLRTYKGEFLQTTLPALENIQAALIKAGLSQQVKITVPLNADVYQTESNLPSGGDFRPDIRDLMINIISFLSTNGAPLTINIYPFLSLYADPHFPVDYAFFSGGNSAPVVDGSVTYTNVFEANFDTLIWALEKNGFSSMPVIVGEVGWPTDGDINANKENARRFNQGLLEHIANGQGTPKRPSPSDIYLFSLLDEDVKSIEPGNFERHWGIFNFDGTIKYHLNFARKGELVAAKGVKYLEQQWCVLAPGASVEDANLPGSLATACSHADCTSLGYGSSCGGLNARDNASYAFNMYYQTADQRTGTCEFSNLAAITKVDPSHGSCRFEIMIDMTMRQPSSEGVPKSGTWTTWSGDAGRLVEFSNQWVSIFLVMLFLPYFVCLF